jgi:hypothetical protein
MTRSRRLEPLFDHEGRRTPEQHELSLRIADGGSCPVTINIKVEPLRRYSKPETDEGGRDRKPPQRRDEQRQNENCHREKPKRARAESRNDNR